MSNTIKLKGCGRYEEAFANAALTPGHLIEVMSTGKVRKHATEGGYAERAFALEDALQGKTIDDAYAADDKVGYTLACPGDEVFAYIAAGENVAVGDRLISNGDGTLQKETGAGSGVTVKQVIATARQAINLTGGGAVATRIAVRVL